MEGTARAKVQGQEPAGARRRQGEKVRVIQATRPGFCQKREGADLPEGTREPKSAVRVYFFKGLAARSSRLPSIIHP